MMSAIHIFLANSCLVLISLILMLYVVLDGFNLGVGVLCLFTREPRERGAMLTALRSHWSANETWLLLLGATLFGAFPVAFAVTWHALFMPIVLMLGGLIVRTVALAARSHVRRPAPWELACGFGSLLATLAQGFALGALLDGLTMRQQLFIGGVWDWLSPFSALVAVGLTAGYTLLGSTYMLRKSHGDFRQHNLRRARLSVWLMMASAMAVTLWMPALHPRVAQTWFNASGVSYLAVFPLLAIAAFLFLLRALRRGHLCSPFAWSVLIFCASYFGMALSIYPYIIPQTVTIAEAAAPNDTLVLVLTAIGVLMPFLLVYNGYQYLLARGRTDGHGYAQEHHTEPRTP